MVTEIAKLIFYWSVDNCLTYIPYLRETPRALHFRSRADTWRFETRGRGADKNSLSIVVSAQPDLRPVIPLGLRTRLPSERSAL